MRENVTIKNQSRSWNIIKQDGSIVGTSRNLKVAVQNCYDENYIITNMTDILDNIYRADNIFNILGGF